MRTLSLIILISALFAGPAYAVADDNAATGDKAKIEKLELDVKQLTEELHRMRMQYTALQTQLDSVRNILGASNVFGAAEKNEFGTQLCFDQISNLKKTQTKLKALGYKDEHPDAINVNRALKNRMLECDIEAADSKALDN